MGTPHTGTDPPQIGDQDDLWRRIDPSNHVVRDENAGGWRISSGAFYDSRDGSPMSTLLGRLDTPERALAKWPGWGFAAITAGLARQWHQQVIWAPTDDDPTHVLVRGKKTGATRRAFAYQAQASWVVDIRPD